MSGCREDRSARMKSIVTAALAVTMILLAMPVAAQITVSTDAALYSVGDVVTVTIRNDGDTDAWFVSYPACVIWNVDTDTCAYGCTGLPVVWTLGPGETDITEHDTALMPDEPGNYIVQAAVSGAPPGSVTSAAYVLQAAVPAVPVSWSGLKAIYR